MERLVYVVCPDQQSAENAVEALVEASFTTDRIQIWARVDGDRPRRVPLLQQRHIVGGAVTGGILGLFLGVALGVSAGAAPDANMLAAVLRFGVSALCAGVFVGGVAGMIQWRLRPAYPPDVRTGSPITVGAETSPQRIEVARQALEAGSRQPTHVTDAGEPPPVSSSEWIAHERPAHKA